MGLAIQRSRVPRQELFVTSKIPCGASAGAVAELIRYDLAQLMLPQLDLLLIHQPNPPFCNSSDQIMATWAAMQAAVHANLTRAVGVSNFEPNQLAQLRPAPAVNQIKLHVGSVDGATIDYCAAHGIMVEAYSPLGGRDGKVSAIPQVLSVAKAHNKSSAQVALKWIVQHGHNFVTSSGTSQYDLEDLDMESWQLTSAEMEQLDHAK